MLKFVTLVFAIISPFLVECSGDGNIHLLADEVEAALRSCVTTGANKESGANPRPARSAESRGQNQYDNQYGDVSPRIDGYTHESNQYNHERRNTSDMKEQMHVLNATDYDYGGYGMGNVGEKFVHSVPRPAIPNRTRRSEPLITKSDSDQCLSQCVFANLQVVDVRGIPRETDLWNKVQSSVNSQQSRAALRDQIRACFQELQSEAEDDGCSYSNKLEKCLMLRFSDRSISRDSNKN